MPKHNRTHEDRRLLTYIVKYQREYGCPPSNRDMANMLGVDVSAAHRRVQHLISAGYVVRPPMLSRTMRVTLEGYQFVAYARIEAGEAL